MSARLARHSAVFQNHNERISHVHFGTLPPRAWQYYAERARQTHHGWVDDFGNGREELLWEILAVIESGRPFTDECRQRLNRLAWNRAKKHRRMPTAFPQKTIAR